jgi:AcrR family transcriptional regulator
MAKPPSRKRVEESDLAAKKPSQRSTYRRTATTRRQILDAAILCLQTHGYGSVTNALIADAAGVSRGAMMHHFPTRLDLLAAVVRYAYDRVIAYRTSELEKLPPGLPRFRAVIDLAWATARMPEGIAVNEVRIGARSDPETAEQLKPIMQAISRDYADFIDRQVAEAGLESDDALRGLAATTALSVRSLSVGRYQPPSPRMIENVLATLKTIRETIIERQLGPQARLPDEHKSASSRKRA